MSVITFENIAQRLADHARAEAARNAPAAVARRAVYTLASALADLAPDERRAIMRLLAAETTELHATTV